MTTVFDDTPTYPGISGDRAALSSQPDSGEGAT